MTVTVTVRARAVPVTVKHQDTTLTVDPWQSRELHLDGLADLTIIEGEPTAKDPPVEEPPADEKPYHGMVPPPKSKRAPAADSDSTQVD